MKAVLKKLVYFILGAVQKWRHCRQTKHFFPEGPRPEFSYAMLSTPRPMWGLLVQIITGHNYMKRQQWIIDTNNKTQAEDPTCTLCQDGEMSSQHILGECGALIPLRQKFFNASFLLPPFDHLKKRELVGFLREAPVDELKFFLEAV